MKASRADGIAVSRSEWVAKTNLDERIYLRRSFVGWTVAAFIVLGDQPRTPPSVVPALLAAHRAGGRAIVSPSYRGTRGTPVLFTSEIFPELLALRGDEGARAVVARRPERVDTVAVDAPMPPDVDTPEDFARLHVE